MTLNTVPFQALSNSVYKSKYQLIDKTGKEIDKDRVDSYRRVSRALAANEKESDFWAAEFMSAMCAGAIPAGRIISNAGAEEHKPNTSMINCLAGETLVLTDKGIFTIRELSEEKSVNVLNGDGAWSSVTFNSYGVQPVYAISFRFADGKNLHTVRATANHRWIMPNGQVITTEFWLSGSRVKGFGTVPNLTIPKIHVIQEEYKLGLIHGLVYGDGNYYHYDHDVFDLTLCHDKMQLMPLVSSILNQKAKGPYLMNKDTGCEAYRFSRISSSFNLKELPSVTATPSYIKGFFTGLLATDGGVHGSDERSISVILFGQKPLMDYLDQVLPLIGVLPSGTVKKIASEGQITNYGKRKKDIYSYHVHPSTVDPNDLLLDKHKDKFRITTNGLNQIKKWHLADVNLTPELAEVFCCEEPLTKSFCLFHGMLTGNCVVAGTIKDSIDGIGQSVKESLQTLSGGSGIGYEFSTLRPKGAFVNGVGAKTSGPLPFADIFDKGCFTIASAGGRRGAQMATFDLRHPDVIEFIKAKRENGRFRQFNISVLASDEFFSDDQTWTFRFPVRKTDFLENAETMWDYWHVKDPEYITNDDGKTLFKIYGQINKEELWDLILKSNYDYAEPGMILIDNVNHSNNLWFCENITASNPCVVAGTQILTKDGYKSIETLVGQSVDIWNGFEWSTVEPRITGTDQNVLTVSFSNGTELTCTEYHRFKLQDNITVEAQDLNLHDKVATYFMPDGFKCQSIEVIGIKVAGVADTVYCFNEPKRHTAIFNGVMTAQCGEQMLPPHGACLLGSINLTNFVIYPFTSEAYFDWIGYSNIVAIFTRMLDNVVEFNNLPLPEQREEIYRKRRHGMGFFGLGSCLTMLGIRYDTPDALSFATRVAKDMALVGYKVGAELAKEKGSAPIMNETFEVTPEMLRYSSVLNEADIGKVFLGKELFLKSRYMQQLLQDQPELQHMLTKFGCRFTHHTSIAPTGTISLAMGNAASNGIEPSFSHYFQRNVTVEGKKTRQQEPVYSYEFLLWKEFNSNSGLSDEELLANLPSSFITADTISWKAHVDMVAAVQKWVDSSISKTINVPTDISFEDFKDIYTYAQQKGCKAISTYRYNPETLGAILSRNEDLENSKYEFTMNDGTIIVCKGSDRVEYEGEITTAENLFNALKEGTYGKF